MRRIEDHDVGGSVNKEGKTSAIGRTGSDSGCSVELLVVWIFGCQGVVLVFEEVRAGEEGCKSTLGVDDGKFLLPGYSKDIVGFGEGDALRCSDQGGSHDLGGGADEEQNCTSRAVTVPTSFPPSDPVSETKR